MCNAACYEETCRHELLEETKPNSLLGSVLASFLVFLKGLKLAGGLALGTSEGREGSLLGSEAPGRESQHGLDMVCEA